MTEDEEDLTSIYPLLSGEELEEWRLLKLKLLLKDAAHIHRIIGPKYTRRGTIEDCLIQSRLDRFYFSEWGTWIQCLKELRHHTTSILSDHDPVLIRITLPTGSNNTLNIPRKSYFKENFNVLSVKRTWKY
jgi:hypothetical protein